MKIFTKLWNIIENVPPVVGSYYKPIGKKVKIVGWDLYSEVVQVVEIRGDTVKFRGKEGFEILSFRKFWRSFDAVPEALKISLKRRERK